MISSLRLPRLLLLSILVLIALGLLYLDFGSSLSLAQSSVNNSTVAPDISSLPWFITRTAGITAYLLMFLVVLLGTGMTTSYIYRFINPVQAWVVHKYLSLALGVALLTHILALLFDKFVDFNWLDILIPFASSYNPIFLSLGIFAFYILLVVIFSSLFFRLKYKKAWRGIHYAVYPLFMLSFLHGAFIGTDSNTVWMQTAYLSTGLIFSGLFIYRFIIYIFKKS